MNKYNIYILKKGGQAGTVCCTVVVMDVLYMNTMINHCIRKTTLSG